VARPPPAPAPAPIVPVTSSLSVSDELATACKLNFNDIKSAPKFDFDRSALAADDDAILSQIAACVTTGPLAGRALQLIGRADPRGESEYNMALGTRRASSVGDFLAGRGVNSSNVEMSSRGKLDATGDDEAGWQRDRRVDIVLN
jgi:peptidoglycan-associated lipoprotein